MELGGEHLIHASREHVWAALNDPAVLEACIPGVQGLEKRSDTEFAATVAAKIGPVNARFRGAVTLSDLDPPNGYTIAGEGTGGAAGFARGRARVRLADADGGATRLAWEADVHVGGKLAQIGSRLVGGVAKRLAGAFFDALSERIGGSGAASDVPLADAAQAAGETPRGAGPIYRIAAAVAAIAAVVLLALYA